MKVGDEFKKLPQSVKRGPFPKPTSLYNGPQVIAASKRKHLEELMSNIPVKKRRIWSSII
jgi:hypothetical protein